ncbi:hypothetical protein CTEN210_12824 [Chaetoceros tenuissimus]|uniref:Uncharacterized protein n=1 Tax=Chaetoceros tenuissimus TaxID=426638 RepID=A0AAD3D232_9STRA|nr:hypothetical protein CTEN210_12824 [Chaetoceros tenuissimus]
MIPEWLIGTWERTYIQRRRKDIPPHKQQEDTIHPTQNSPIETSHLNKPDSTIKVRYIQTPWAFIDIRSKLVNESESGEQPMAFAGVTTVLQRKDFVPLVHWHSCLDLDEKNIDCYERWREAEDGTPRLTQDTGYFQKCSETDRHVYMEYDPDRTLLEQWVRVDNAKEFLAVRSKDGNTVLILAGIYFGYADQVNKMFVSGIVQGGDYLQKENWIVETNAVDFRKVGYALEIPSGEWTVLKGSTLPLSTIDCIQV